jgi:hypothetical protein
MQVTLAQSFQYDPESKLQSLQWKQPTSPLPKKAGMSKSQMKKMLITFFDMKDTVRFTRPNSQPGLLCEKNELVT